MNVQVIERDGKPEWAVIPYEAYRRLVEESEMLQDIRAYNEAKKAIEEGEDLIPKPGKAGSAGSCSEVWRTAKPSWITTWNK